MCDVTNDISILNHYFPEDDHESRTILKVVLHVFPLCISIEYSTNVLNIKVFVRFNLQKIDIQNRYCML